MADKKISELTTVTSPVNADIIPTVVNTGTTPITKKVTWTVVKAFLKTYFDGLYATVLGADDNYATDAEKVKLGNLSGTNTGDNVEVTAQTVGFTVTKGTTPKTLTVALDANVSGTNSGDSATPAETTTTIGALINGATSKTTPVDADYVGLMDSEASNILKKLSWANIKATLKTYFDTLYTTVAGFTLTGAIDLGENAGLVLDAVLSADGKYSGIVEVVTAGETIAFGDVVYLKTSDSQWYLADADADATAGAVRIAIAVTSGTDNGSMTIMTYGKINAAANFPALTVGAPVYISTTPGDVQTAQPSGTDDVIRIVGYGNTGDELMFNPSLDYITHI